jgi:AsmA-like C-terminal region
MDLNDWTGKNESANIAATTTTTTSGYSSEPFQVPADMNVSINAKAGRVIYDNVNYDNIAGTLLFNDQTVTLQGVRANALDGTIILNGSYSTKVNKSNPDITLSYDIDDMDVQKAFMSFNPIQAIMPIGKYLSGKLSSELNMSGSLKENMMPNLQSLTGKGNLLLLQGVLQKFAPLEKIAAALQIDRLKSISVKEIRNYIEFANGKVLVKPFNLKIEDIEMIIGGRHGFDQSIEYFVEMKVPRKYIGAAGNNLINGLVSDANKKGIPLTLGEKVDLNIKVGGTLNSPSIKIDLAKMAGSVIEDLKDQAKDYAKEKLDSAREKIKDTITSKVKEKVLDKIFGKDTTKVKPPTDSPAKKSDPKVKDILKDIWNKKKKKDSL